MSMGMSMSGCAKIMIVDDEPSTRLLVKTVAEEAGYLCRAAEGGEEALALFERERPDVVVLDVMMPKVDGYEVCRRIRVMDENVPVLFLSAKGDIVDKRTGFSNGGDDYIVKPFDEEELLMRVEALLRRARRAKVAGTGEDAPDAGGSDSPARLQLGAFDFDTLRHEVRKDGRAVVLTPKKFQLLYQLASHRCQVMGKEELIECVWGGEYLDDAINIAVHVRNIRKKIEPNPAKPQHLKTVWGVGYVFEA